MLHWGSKLCGPNLKGCFRLGRFLSASARTTEPVLKKKRSPKTTRVQTEKRPNAKKDSDRDTNNTIVDIKSFEKFKSIYNHLLVPQHFGFSEDECTELGPYARKLGHHARNLRHAYLQLKNKDKPWVQELQKMGFVWAPREATFQLYVRAVRHYRELYGDYIIPSKFIVPNDFDLWPMEFHGLLLGRAFERIRLLDLPPQRKAYLEAMGIPIGNLISQKVERLLEAIEVYKKIHQQTGKTLQISKTFVVPLFDEKWPEKLWGMKLGDAVYTMRHKSYPIDYLDQLKAAGIHPLPKEYAEEKNSEEKVD